MQTRTIRAAAQAPTSRRGAEQHDRTSKPTCIHGPVNQPMPPCTMIAATVANLQRVSP